jgi:hypothetical protein
MFITRCCGRVGRGGTDFQKFYLGALCIGAVGATAFTQQVLSLISKSKTDLLGLLFSTLPTAQDFGQHNSYLHDSLGLRLDHKGVTKESLEKCGGSIEDLKMFVESARDSAVSIEQPLKRYFKTYSGEKTLKVAKTSHNRESKYEEEVKDRDGVERKYSNAFCGSLDVKLEAMELDPVLRSKISYAHVEGLKKDIVSRFDPSMLCIVVRSTDVESYREKVETSPDECKYYVIQGLHSFLALQQLNKDGKLCKLPGMEGGYVTVSLVNVDQPELLLYGHLRGNALASTFIRKPQPQV